MTDALPDDTEPSAEALEAAFEINLWGVTARDIALALDRFRAAGIAVLTQERDAACKAHVECAESLDVAARERDEARRSAETLEAEVGRLCAERDAVVDDFASDCAAQPTPDDVERAREPTLLKRAEQLWDDLQKNELGGFSGINRPFWIVQAFKEVDAVARREGAELRALDEAVIEWAREAVTAMEARAGYSLAHNELRKALAARDAAIGAREGEE